MAEKIDINEELTELLRVSTDEQIEAIDEKILDELYEILNMRENERPKAKDPLANTLSGLTPGAKPNPLENLTYNLAEKDTPKKQKFEEIFTALTGADRDPLSYMISGLTPKAAPNPLASLNDNLVGRSSKQQIVERLVVQMLGDRLKQNRSAEIQEATAVEEEPVEQTAEPEETQQEAESEPTESTEQEEVTNTGHKPRPQNFDYLQSIAKPENWLERMMDNLKALARRGGSRQADYASDVKTEAAPVNAPVKPDPVQSQSRQGMFGAFASTMGKFAKSAMDRVAKTARAVKIGVSELINDHELVKDVDYQNQIIYSFLTDNLIGRNLKSELKSELEREKLDQDCVDELESLIKFRSELAHTKAMAVTYMDMEHSNKRPVGVDNVKDWFKQCDSDLSIPNENSLSELCGKIVCDFQDLELDEAEDKYASFFGGDKQMARELFYMCVDHDYENEKLKSMLHYMSAQCGLRSIEIIKEAAESKARGQTQAQTR